MADQPDVIRKLALANASDISQKFFSSDKTVNRHDIIGTVRENGTGSDFEIQKRVVIAEQKVGWFQTVHTIFADNASMHDYRRLADKKSKRPQIPFCRTRREFHIKTGNRLFHMGYLFLRCRTKGIILFIIIA